MYKVIVILIFTFFSSNLIALEKVLVPDYVNKETKSPWNFYENFEGGKLNFQYVKKSKNIGNSPGKKPYKFKKDPDGNTLLMRAILKSPYSKELVHVLIDNGAEIEELDSYKRTPLMLTCYPGIGGYEEAHSLILAGADIKKQDRGGSTAISLAAQNGYLNICQLPKFLYVLE